jgi:anti-sigma B factor antagonist
MLFARQGSQQRRTTMSSRKENGATSDAWTWKADPLTNTVSLGGEVDFTVSPAVRDRFVAFIEKSKGDVFLDLGELHYIDSSGLAALIEGRKLLKGKGRRITITAISHQVRKLFELTQIGELFGL